MADYHSLPSIYLGAGKDGKDLYESIYDAYELNSARFQSLNQFLKYLVQSGLDHDKTIKRG